MNIKNELLKQAAYAVHDYKIKQADLGYAAGPFWEWGQAVARNTPTPVLDGVKAVGDFMYDNRKPLLWTAAAALGLHLWNKRRKAKQLEEKARVQEIQNNGVPNDVLAPNQASENVSKKALDPAKALAAVTATPKTAEYRLATVMNYMYS